MTVVEGPVILDRISALADSLRCRMLLLLETQELTVSELGAVLQLPQSTTSRHLKHLADAGWVESRPDGTRRLYRMPSRNHDLSAQGLWTSVRDPLQQLPSFAQDRQRLAGVLAERRTRSQAFFDSEAGNWDKLRDELFGDSFFFHGLLGLLDPTWAVADLGCGTGPVSEALAPNVGQVIAVDGSWRMLATARQRLERFDNVALRQGDLESLPIGDGELDAATLILVLHHLPNPHRAIEEVHRTLRPGGKLLIVDMLPHQRQEYRLEMGHVWMGFSESQLAPQLSAAGLIPGAWRTLPVDSRAKGPTLFGLTAQRPFEGLSAVAVDPEEQKQQLN